ncbi:uncharacterized protein LOC143051019 isoform X2 [Mytilus galloprovincialis]|uniref:uncharacterized protein LOC143051019 isoform X2 n=1 Tax=Mytilus galloprovincialis TaxID=29158 RepID=UPI003F7C27EC
MKSVILTITVLLGLLFVPVIEMKSKRCHKRPTVDLVKSASFNIGLESRNGINYEWQSKNTTESNMFDDWADREPKTIEVDSCGFIYNLKWYAARRVACVIQPYSFICESRFD